MQPQHTIYYNLLIEAQEILEADRADIAALALFRNLKFITADALTGSGVRFPGFFARLDYLLRTHESDRPVRYFMHQFRANHGRRSEHEWTDESVREAISAVAQFIHDITNIPIPETVTLRDLRLPPRMPSKGKKFYKSLQAVLISKMNGEMVVHIDLEGTSQAAILLPKEGVDQKTAFNWMDEQTQLSLVDAAIWGDEEERFVEARLVVLEPDYLVDVSPLAECFRTLAMTTIANHALYFVNRYKVKTSSEALFQGNLSNYFLDELIHTTDSTAQFNDLFKASFGLFPMEYLLLFPDDTSLVQFMKTRAKVQHRHLVRVVNNDLQRLRPQVVADETLLEPTYMSPEIGIQGRLDLLHQNGPTTTIIELKSGKPPWPPEDHDAVAVNHATQARVYRMLLHQVDKISNDAIRVYLLYSSSEREGTNLRYVTHLTSQEQRIIDVRNAIALTEKAFASVNDLKSLEAIMRQWTLSSCGLSSDARIPGFFREQFEHFQGALNGLSPVAKDYFLAATAFISREQWEARMGDGKTRRGHAGLWQKATDDFQDPDRLFPLQISQNFIDTNEPWMELRLTEGDPGLFNFRIGDIVVLYPADGPNALPTDQQIVKCFIKKELNAEGVLQLGFRYAQKNKKLFQGVANWAIEPDYMDQLFQGMHREVFAFSASQSRMKNVLLGEEVPKEPASNEDLNVAIQVQLLPESEEELRLLLIKALAAPDFFLLVGPPGTGKTNLFLRHFVAATQQAPKETVLLLAYTNRAVDEICGAVSEALTRKDDFLRIGSSHSCDPAYHQQLLQNLAKQASNREELKELIAKRSVVVSTVASILNRPDIFKLKDFDRIVVDEASQVLEPMLVSILNRAKRFVLIGDQKQLPAVVQQQPMPDTLIPDSLRNIGLTDFRNSLFERLIAQFAKRIDLWGTLTHQGRMHPSISQFVNAQWYKGALRTAQLSHQNEQEKLPNCAHALFAQRVVFIDIENANFQRPKSNQAEAAVVVDIVRTILSQQAGIESSEIGVISPYRSQNALIKSLLRKSSIAGAENIMVDTVERFQGSQRNFIIYSATVQSLAQLAFLAESTHLGSDGIEVDRKLNVAFTRARKHFTLVGNGELLAENRHYGALISYATKLSMENHPL